MPGASAGTEPGVNPKQSQVWPIPKFLKDVVRLDMLPVKIPFVYIHVLEPTPLNRINAPRSHIQQ